MRRRFLSLAFASLFAVSVVVPASAVEPEPAASAPPVASEPAPSSEVAPTPDPTPQPTPESTLAPETPAPTEPPASPDPAPPASAPPEPSDPPATEPATPEVPASIEPDVSAEPDVSPEPDDAGETEDFIVVLRPGTNPGAEARQHARAEGVAAERTFTTAIDGYAATLDEKQVAALEDDPDVLAVVPDETFTIQAQTIPTGVSRVGGPTSPSANIDGVDDRVDADVAIVDTGIQPNHPDLNVVGGYDCVTRSASADKWRDVHGHGTHVAGTVGAKDNGSGVVGVAPGARLWAVKILDDSGSGKLSWYICGLDWIAAQRDPGDPSRPLFEAVNMSVGKRRTITDDNNCGRTTIDGLHQAVCRVVEAGIPVAVAAANNSENASKWVPATYKEVITVSALADTDGKAGGLGGKRCYSWGSYDVDDTFANFSNYGAVVDLMAPGKCIWSTMPGSSYAYMSGTSMATPAVAGAIALYKETRPRATPAEVKEALQYLGNVGWKVSTDPDNKHEKLLDVRRVANLGDFSFVAPSAAHVGELGGSISVPISITRSSTFFERVRLSVASLPAGWTASLSTTSLLGWTARTTTLTVTVPSGTREGTYELRVGGSNQGRSRSVAVPVVVSGDRPLAHAPTVRFPTSGTIGSTVPAVIRWRPASDKGSSITGYQWAYRAGDGGWSAAVSTGMTRKATKGLTPGIRYEFRVRARDAVGNWSAWSVTPKPYTALVSNDRSGSLTYRGSWYGSSSSSATSGTLKNSTRTGSTVRVSVTSRGLAVIAPTSPTRGWLEVRVNGVLVKTVSLKGKSRARRLVWSQAWSTSATRTLELRVVRSSTRPLVSLDAIVVLK